MEVYQPLNRYEYCQTKVIAKKINRVEKNEVKVKPLLYKTMLSVLLILFIVVTTVFVKIDAKAPISYIPEENEVLFVVGSGDSLWTIASRYYSEIEDTGFAIYLIKQRNGLKESTIYPGQAIILPHIE